MGAGKIHLRFAMFISLRSAADDNRAIIDLPGDSNVGERFSAGVGYPELTGILCATIRQAVILRQL